MDDIGSTEFGDWILNEIARQRDLPKPASKPGSGERPSRLQTLQGAAALLMEFSRLQAHMLGGPADHPMPPAHDEEIGPGQLRRRFGSARPIGIKNH